MKKLNIFLLLAFLTSSLYAQQPQLWLERESFNDIIFEDGFEDMTLPPFTTTGHMPWTINGLDAFEGSHSAESGQTTLLEGSSIHLKVEVPAFTTTVLTFDAKTNVSGGFNVLWINDIETLVIDPIGQWESYEVELAPGTNDLEWRHGAIGSANLRLDNIRIVTKDHGIVRIQDGNEGVGKILVSDEFGNARWQDTHQIGDLAYGGIVFWVDESGKHGLVCASVDQGSANWGPSSNVTGAIKDNIYSGMMNTERIIINQGTNSYAADLCAEYAGGGYGDWYLPSKQELNLMFLSGIGGFRSIGYWSSTEFNVNDAWLQNFGNGNQLNFSKFNSNFFVRAVRAF